MKAKRTFVTAVLALGMAILTGSVIAKPAALPYFDATYSASIKGVPITATRSFSAISNNVSELHFNADSWIASLDENAKFIWEQDAIKPLRFSHERKIIGRQEIKRLTFDWANNKIVSVDKERTYTMDNSEKALDHLSFQLQLQYDLLKGQLNNKYRIADKNSIKEYRFEIMEEEVINTEVGQLNTVKIKVLRQDKGRITYIWFAKDWHYLLVRLEQFEDGDMEFELQLTKATVAQQAVTGL